MGSCVSVHREPESTVRLRLSFGSRNGKILIPSVVDQNTDKVNAGDCTVADVDSKSRWSRPGSKEEAFFDSQPWLDSEGEDDFLSVNGDFTPSRGNTPVHPSFLASTPRVNELPSADGTLDSIPSPSSPEKKKRLSELFKERLRADLHIEEENVIPETKATNSVHQYLKSTNGTPHSRGERTPNGLFKAEDDSGKSVQCCLPRLLSSRSFNERRKRMSPSP